MDFFSNIKFNGELIENEYCTITYSGKLFQNNSDLVSIVYGYGENWAHTTEQKMEKTEEGFNVQIKLLNSFNTFNFCFKNYNNEWDNNEYQNYSVPISKQIIDDSFIINTDILSEILNNMIKIDLSKPEIKKIENIQTEQSQEFIENDITKEAKSETLVPFDIEIEQDEPLNIEETFVNSVDIKSLDNDIEKLFDELYVNENSNNKQDLLDNILSNSNEIQNTDNTNNSNTNLSNITENKTEDSSYTSLINEILSPIVTSSVFEEENLDDLSSVSTSSIENEVNKNINVADIFPVVENDVNENINKIDIFSIAENEVNKNINVADIFPIVENKIDENIFSINFKETKEKLEEDFNLDQKINDLISDLYNNATQYSTYNSEKNKINSDIQNDSTKNNISVENAEPSDVNEISESLEDPIEESLMDVLNVDNSLNNTSLINVKSDKYIVSPRSLRKFYLLKKKIKLALYKLFFTIPRIIKRQFQDNKN